MKHSFVRAGVAALALFAAALPRLHAAFTNTTLGTGYDGSQGALGANVTVGPNGYFQGVYCTGDDPGTGTSDGLLNYVYQDSGGTHVVSFTAPTISSVSSASIYEFELPIAQQLSIAVDSNNIPHIIFMGYQSSTDNNINSPRMVMYMTYSGSGDISSISNWTVQNLASYTSSSGDFFVPQVAIAIDPTTNRPVAAWDETDATGTASTVHYAARGSDGTWASPSTALTGATLGTNSAQAFDWISLAVDTNGNYDIAGAVSTGANENYNELFFATNASGSWSAGSVVSAATSVFLIGQTAMVLDSGNNPRIAWESGSDNTIHLTTYKGTGTITAAANWNDVSVIGYYANDTSTSDYQSVNYGPYGSYVGYAINASNEELITFYDQTGTSATGYTYMLREIVRTGESGSFTELPQATSSTSVGIGYDISAALRSDGTAGIMYDTFNPGTLLDTDMYLATGSTGVTTAPTVTTPTDTSVVSTSATLGGDVTGNGGATVSASGVVYSVTTTNGNPQLSGTGVTDVPTSSGVDSGTFTVNAAGLSPNTGYSFAAYATNTVGTSYSTVGTFTTSANPPTVTSPTDTSITETAATLGGDVTSDGGATLSKRGVVYSKTSVNSAPALDGTGVSELDDGSTSTGTFTENATGLTPGTAYSYAGFATNTAGTTYTRGTFTTLSPPSAQAQSYAVVESALVTGTSGTAGTGLLNGASSPESYTLIVSAINGSGANVGASTAGTYGHLTAASTGSLGYDADITSSINSAATGSHPVDTFTYTISDGNGGTATQNATFTIDRPPSLQAQNNPVLEGGSVSGTSGTGGTGFLDGDSDPDGDSLSISAIDGSSGNVGSSLAGTYGHLTANANGSYTYNADNTAAIDAGATGSHVTDTFTYAASDGQGGTTTQTATFTIDRPPAVTAGTTSTYYGTATALDSGLVLGDPDSASVTGATITISNYQTGDVLHFTNGSGITGSYSAGTLTLSGTASAIAYQTALQSITFSTTSGSASARTINWVVDIGSASNVAVTSTVDIYSYPVVAPSGNTPTFTGGGSAVLLDSAITVTAGTDASIAGTTVTLASPITGDTLAFNNGADTQFFADSSTITASYTGGVLTLTGAASASDYQTALQSVAYSFSPTNGDPTGGGSHTSRAISWVVTDSNSEPSATANSSLTVSHAAPVVTPSGNPAPSFSGGSSTPVVLDSGIAVTDADSSGTLATATIALSAGYVAGDTLTFANDGSTMGNIAVSANSGSSLVLASSGATATLAQWDAALRSVTYSFSPSSGDSTADGTETSRTISWTVTDGSSSNGTSDTGTSSLSLSHVAPTVTAGASVNFSVGGGAVTLDNAIALADVDSGNTLAGATVSITSGYFGGDTLAFTNDGSTMGNIAGSYAAGTLTLTSSGATATLTQWQAALDSVTYDFSGSDPTDGGTDNSRTITWTVDDGSASNGSSTGVTSTVSLAPAVLSLTMPTAGNYVAGDTLSFTVNFSSAVAVTGSPTLSLTVGGNSENAAYVSGSGTTALVFTYTVQASDAPGAVAVVSPLVLGDAGTINAVSGGQAAVLAFAPSPQTAAGVAIQLVPTLTWNTPVGITYGTALSETQLDAAATYGGNTVDGTYAYSDADGTIQDGTILAGGNPTLTVIFTPSNTDYQSVTAQVILAVAPAATTVTWNTPPALTYGAPLTTDQLSATGSQPGAVAYSNAGGQVRAGTVLPAGQQTLTATFTPTDSVDYAPSTAQVTLTVNPATPAVSWTPAVTTFTYGASLSTAELNAQGMTEGNVLAGGYTYTLGSTTLTTGSLLPAGTDVVTVTFTPYSSNYGPATNTATFTVSQATPTLTWNTPGTITYGTVLTGAQLDATASVPGIFAYSPAGGTTPPGGSDTLNVTFTPNDATDYTGATDSVTLTVTPATQTITFPAVSAPAVGAVTLNATASSGLTVTYALVGTTTATLNGAILTLADANPVTVSASQLGNGNYQPATAVQTIQVGKLPQTILLPSIPDHYTGDAPFQITATSMSGTSQTGLSVNFSVTQGSNLATVSKTTLVGGVSQATVTLLGQPGPVTIRASSGASGAYGVAPTQEVSFSVTVETYTPSIGGTHGHVSSGDVVVDPTRSVMIAGVNLYEVTADDTMAGTLSSDGTNGELIGYLPTLGQAFATDIAPDPSGNFTATTTSFGGSATPVTLTITGVANQSGYTGTIQPGDIEFSTVADPSTGPTSDLAGYYESTDTDTSSGTTYSIVGTQGEVFVLADTPAGVSVGGGDVNASTGSFTVQSTQSSTSSTVSVAGSIDPATDTVSGTVTTTTNTGQTSVVSYSGTADTVAAVDFLANMSAQGMVSPELPLVVGFVIDGPNAKTVVLRGIGPALAPFGVSSPLAQPVLTLYGSSDNILASNQGWGGAAGLVSAFAEVGAFALPPTSADAALETTLPPGSYSIVVSDAINDGGGDALAEIYDATIDPSEATQKLVNISTRGQVTASAPLTGGFVIGGNAPKTVLIRGIGPGLQPFGVTGYLPAPSLTLYNSSDTALATNQIWGTPVSIGSGQTSATAAQISAAAAEAGAFSLPAGSADSALIITLQPGNYSAVVTGANGGSGTALVEVYELPNQ